jgi:hypothetical protein
VTTNHPDLPPRWRCIRDDCPQQGIWQAGTEADLAEHQDSHKPPVVHTNPTGRNYGKADI